MSGWQVAHFSEPTKRLSASAGGSARLEHPQRTTAAATRATVADARHGVRSSGWLTTLTMHRPSYTLQQALHVENRSQGRRIWTAAASGAGGSCTARRQSAMAAPGASV